MYRARDDAIDGPLCLALCCGCGDGIVWTSWAAMCRRSRGGPPRAERTILHAVVVAGIDMTL